MAVVYPRLSQMAIDILSIPAMSAEQEHVSSDTRRTISWGRARLGAKNIMETECKKRVFQMVTLIPLHHFYGVSRDPELHPHFLR
jgi:hypothetical protein